MDEIKLAYHFGHGFVQNRNTSRVISRLDELANLGSTSSSLMMWSHQKRQWFHFNLSWPAIRLVCTASQMFALGRDGRVLIADATGVAEELVNKGTQTEFRDMCLIGDNLYTEK